MSHSCVRVDLTEDVVTSYDQTKTTVLGRARSKIIGGNTALGPQLTKFIDVFTDTASFTSQTPSGAMHLTENGRLFIASSPSGGLLPIILYSFNLSTGETSFIGKISVPLANAAATTHTIRGLKVSDVGTTGWKIFIATTGSVLVNGGLYVANSINLADFVPSGTTISFATGSNQKACYFLQSSSAVGPSHLMTQAAGVINDYTNSLVYLHNGVSATHQYHWFDYSGTLDCPGQTFTITIASPGVITATAHGYNNNDQVTLSTTGALPTGLAGSTVYFARNVTANTLELSATSGGASINTTGTQSGTHTIRRAFGITTSLTYDKTGNLPALVGTLLLTNDDDLVIPNSGINTSLPCASFLTSSQVYRGRLSELTSGAITWPNLESYNILSNTISTPTATFGSYSETLQKWFYVTNTTKVIIKPDGNNIIDRVFGSLFNEVLEAIPLDTVNFGFPAIVGFEQRHGWVLISSSTAGVRGITVADIRSDAMFDYSMVISPVIEVNSATLKSIGTIESLFEQTGTMEFYYRTSGFGSSTGGWININEAEDLNIALGTQVQFKVLFDIANEDASTPAQIIALIMGITNIESMSDNWIGSYPNTSEGSPTRIAFRLQHAYTTVVPELIVDVYTDGDVLVASKSTLSDATEFEYSSNNGSSWNSLGTIPNTALTTELRLNMASPPGVPVRARIREA